jgi:hypothetical protein
MSAFAERAWRRSYGGQPSRVDWPASRSGERSEQFAVACQP